MEDVGTSIPAWWAVPPSLKSEVGVLESVKESEVAVARSGEETAAAAGLFFDGVSCSLFLDLRLFGL